MPKKNVKKRKTILENKSESIMNNQKMAQPKHNFLKKKRDLTL